MRSGRLVTSRVTTTQYLYQDPGSRHFRRTPTRGTTATLRAVELKGARTQQYFTIVLATRDSESTTQANAFCSVRCPWARQRVVIPVDKKRTLQDDRVCGSSGLFGSARVASSPTFILADISNVEVAIRPTSRIHCENLYSVPHWQYRLREVRRLQVLVSHCCCTIHGVGN